MPEKDQMMSEFFIKPFTFIDYFNIDWFKWKCNALTEALNKGEEFSHYPYAGNQSKIPIVFDEDDWKFLIQFPPVYWSQALTWRYNAGLLAASQKRQEDPDHRREDGTISYDKVPERGTVKLAGKGGTSLVFDDVWVGFRSLMEKLEKPVLLRKHGDRPPISRDIEGLGLLDIDHLEINEKSPVWRGHYKGGKYDFDLTYPTILPDEYFDNLTREEMKLPPNATEEQIAEKRKKLKAQAHHGFAGMHVMQGQTGQKAIRDWLLAQGLGLLGEARPVKIKDPHTEAPIDVTPGQDPKEMSEHWTNAYGNKDDGGLQRVSIPTIERTLTYKRISPSGVPKVETEKYKMPYLLPGRLFPRLILNLDQRWRLAKRRGVPQKYGIDTIQQWEKAEAEGYGDLSKGTAQEAGRPQAIYQLLKNWDILKPDQKEFLKQSEESRDLLDVLAASRGQSRDFWAKLDNFYAVGWHTNKTDRPITPLDLKPEEVEPVVKKYWQDMVSEATTSFDDCIKNLEKRVARGTFPSAAIPVIEKVGGDLIKVAAALLCLNLNSHRLGIYDPELGLTNTDPGQEQKETNSRQRKAYCFSLYQDLSQAAFGDVGSRRQRQKKKGKSREEGGGWDSRRNQLDPIRYDTLVPNTTYNVARLGWNVPEISEELYKYFGTYRKLIQTRMGKTLEKQIGKDGNQLIDGLVGDLKQEMEVVEELYDKKAEELFRRGITDPEVISNAGEEAVRVGLKTKFGDKTDIEDIIKRHKESKMLGLRLPPELKAEQDKRVDAFLARIPQEDIEKKLIIPKLIYDGKRWIFPIAPSSDTLDSLSEKSDKELFAWWQDILGENKQKLIETLPILFKNIKGEEQAGVNIARALQQQTAEAEPKLPTPAPTPASASPTPASVTQDPLVQQLPAGWEQGIKNAEWLKIHGAQTKMIYEKMREQYKRDVAAKGMTAAMIDPSTKEMRIAFAKLVHDLPEEYK
jgi:hypothetical protein